ncbi:dienelactone hydrolase [Thermoplasmatales archaeon SW_10_69_26]|nr:MAG: dienelactone hydrolase [Thermoplasmatales archaeon SW_10_69_26]
MTEDFHFELPDVGEGVHEGEIVNWLVSEGDQVDEDQDIVEVMTDKATVQISAPVAGTIKELRYDEGTVVDVGDVFVVIGPEGAVETDEEETADTGGEDGAPEAEAGETEAEEDEDEDKTLFELPEGPGGSEDERRPARQRESTPSRSGEVLAMPRVRHAAKDRGVDLASVQATGSQGHVTLQDLEAYLEGEAGGFELEHFDFDLPSVDRDQAREVEPLKGLRKRIAENMTRAKTLQPHFTYVDELRADELVSTRNELKQLGEKRDVNVTYLPLLVKAVVRALREHPRCNALIDEEDQQLVIKQPINVGIAVATDRGLVVPVVKNADEKTLLEIASEIETLAQKAHENRLSMDDLTGGTFTITSLGAVGGMLATPILFHPQVAIMGVHAIRDEPVVEDGEVVPGKKMNLSFTFDHRIVDGYDGALFAQDVKKYLEDPNLLLLEGR